MVRLYRPEDLRHVQRIHEANGLPPNCLPEPEDGTYVIKHVVEKDGIPALISLVRQVGEAYLILDHDAGDPQWRWDALHELVEKGSDAAFLQNLPHVTAWVPPELEGSFGKRLVDLGFVKSPWSSYTTIIR